LWQGATTLREHRGDGHVASLLGAGLDGCQAHVLFAAGENVDPELLQQSRGWSHDEWERADVTLRERGLLDRAGITRAGEQVRAEIESRTDDFALEPYAALGETRVERMIELLRPAALAIARSGDIPFPNPMGLPSVADLEARSDRR
jgi:hypothetical protein